MHSQLAIRYLEAYRQKTDPLLKKYLQEKIKAAAEIGDVPRKLLKQFSQIAMQGKRIRGALVVFGYQLSGGKMTPAIYDASLAMEIFHTAVLVHDDIMDNAKNRRGLTALHKQFENRKAKLKEKNSSQLFGQSLAICAGDGAFYLSWEKLLKSGFSPQILLNACQVFSRYAFRVMNGQVLDLSLSQQKDINEKDVLKMLYLKSGEYSCEMPLTIGVTLAGGMSEHQYQALQNYAKALGWVFQIQDDILGIFADEKTTGKPNTSDIQEGKMTLLLLHLLKHGNPQQLNFHQQLLGKQDISAKEVLQMRQILKQVGSYDYVVNLADKYIEQGKKYMPKITDNSRNQELLESLLDFMLARIS